MITRKVLKTRAIGLLMKTATVVKEIFHLCVAGYGPSQIAKELKIREILTLVEYAKQNGQKLPAVKES